MLYLGTWHTEARSTVLLPLLWLCCSEPVPAGRYGTWGRRAQGLGASLLTNVDSGIKHNLLLCDLRCVV